MYVDNYLSLKCRTVNNEIIRDGGFLANVLSPE